MPLTSVQLKLARHALGLPHRSRRSYRNRFVASVGGADHAEWSAMVGLGLATVSMGETNPSGDRMDWFALTRAGADAALQSGELLCPEDFPPIAAH